MGFPMPLISFEWGGTMTAKEYLSEVQTLQTIIEQKKERIREIRESVLSVRSVRYDLEKVQGGGNVDRIGEAVAKMVDLEKQVENDLLNLMYRKHEVIGQIHALDNYRYIQVLYKRYIEFKSLQTIATEMDLTDQYVREMHPKAVEAFESKYIDFLQERGEG